MNAQLDRLVKAFHWPSISKAFWMFVVAIAVAISVLTISGMMLKALNEKNQTEKNHLYDLQQAYSDTLLEIELIQQYRDNYERLSRKGFTGKEDRLSRVEVIKQVRNSRNLPNLSYTFKPAEQITEYLGQSATGMDIFSTKNVITFTLYDETDLDLLLGQLHNQAQGIHMVEDCSIKRPIFELQLSQSGNINGNCTLNWLSLRKQEIEFGGGSDG